MTTTIVYEEETQKALPQKAEAHTEKETPYNLKSLVAALNEDMYRYLCKGCLDGWDCDWDKLPFRLKPKVGIRKYAFVKKMREALKYIQVYLNEHTSPAMLTKLKDDIRTILVNYITMDLSMTESEKLITSEMNIKDITTDDFFRDISEAKVIVNS